jgi:hypothetical protein
MMVFLSGKKDVESGDSSQTADEPTDPEHPRLLPTTNDPFQELHGDDEGHSHDDHEGDDGQSITSFPESLLQGAAIDDDGAVVLHDDIDYVVVRGMSMVFCEANPDFSNRRISDLQVKGRIDVRSGSIQASEYFLAQELVSAIYDHVDSLTTKIEQCLNEAFRVVGHWNAPLILSLIPRRMEVYQQASAP